MLSQQESRVAAFGVNFSLYVCAYPCRILESDVCFTTACTLVFKISSKDLQIFRATLSQGNTASNEIKKFLQIDTIFLCFLT